MPTHTRVQGACTVAREQGGMHCGQGAGGHALWPGCRGAHTVARVQGGTHCGCSLSVLADLKL